MALPSIPVNDFFPIIRQTLLDTYKVDSLLMQYPYSDFERLDMGLRKMVWGTYPMSTPIFSLSKESPYQILVLESMLGFHNVLVTVSEDENPDLIAFMPFRTEPITVSGINKIMKENGIAIEHATEMQRLYLNLPVIPLDDFIMTVTHLITAFLPDFTSCHVDYVNYAGEEHELNPSEERFQKFSADYIEKLVGHLRDTATAITSGNQALATEKIKILSDNVASYDAMPPLQMTQGLTFLNSYICAHMFETAVHPYYTFQQMTSFQVKINESTSMRELEHLPFEMARKYSILARNYTYGKYSYLIRNVVNYIDQHLATELSLSVLAETFDKNPSYLSNAFKKEVGDTITEYINKARIQASLRYFNTTNMSVGEVADAVGISDFGYFSKLFKKHVGVSPREYKKMIDK